MKTGRSDYDAMLRDTSIPSDEPRFVLRAQDAIAAEVVRFWARLAALRGTPDAVIEQALKQADAMDAWETKKVPDASHLTEGEAKQLAYELKRRRWNRGHGDPSENASAFVAQVAAYGRAPLSRDPNVLAAVLDAITASANDLEARDG